MLAPRFPEYISMLTHLRQMADIMRNQTLKLWYSGQQTLKFDNQILRYLLHKWQQWTNGLAWLWTLNQNGDGWLLQIFRFEYKNVVVHLVARHAYIDHNLVASQTEDTKNLVSNSRISSQVSSFHTGLRGQFSPWIERWQDNGIISKRLCQSALHSWTVCSLVLPSKKT